MIRSKKGIEFTLARIIAIVITLTVFLVLLWPMLSAKMLGAQTQGQCNWNLVLSAGVKAGSLGFAEIDPGCKAEYVTVDDELIGTKLRKAKQRILKYHGIDPATAQQGTTAGYYRDAAQAYPLDSNNQPDYNALRKWALDAIVAEKMRQCSDKMWHGKLDFFTNKNFEERRMCVVCSVLTFSEDIPAILGPNSDQPKTTLYQWMNAEPYFKKTYNAYVSEGFTIPHEPFTLKYRTSKPQAIVFTQVKHSTAMNVIPFLIPAGIGPALTIAALINGYDLVAITKEARDALIGKEYKLITIEPYEELRHFCTDIIA